MLDFTFRQIKLVQILIFCGNILYKCFSNKYKLKDKLTWGLVSQVEF